MYTGMNFHGSRLEAPKAPKAPNPQVVNSLELFEDADVSFKKEARPSPVCFFFVGKDS